MEILWGIVVVVLSLLCWGGQAIALLVPDTAVKLGLIEAEDDVEPAYWADIRGEALWDFFTLWTLVAAGVLLVISEPTWAYFGLVGGGVYVYFAGRGIITRVVMQRHGLRVGSSRNLRLAYTFLTIWGVMAVITLAAAAVSMPTS